MIRDNLLIIFVKNPIPGKVKTRLAQTIGNEKALVVYQNLLFCTLKITKAAANCDKSVFYADYIDHKDIWSEGDFEKHLQKGDSLGARMLNAFESNFQKGYKNVILIGSDCAELTTEIIGLAFNSLENNDVVIGPASDGGYYLIGMNFLIKDVFENKKWSSNSVLSDTLTDLEKNNRSYHLLPELNDIDDEEDWEKSHLYF